MQSADINEPNKKSGEQLEKSKAVFHRAFIFFLVSFSIGVAFWSGYEHGQKQGANIEEAVISPDDAVFINKESQENTIDFGLFWKVWSILKDKYVDKSSLDANKLFYGAIDGMLAATGDPYTTFFSPEENKEFKEDISGTFEGIGAEMGIKDDILTVIAPLEGTPAEKAGIHAGDKILKIDDKDTLDMSLEVAVKKIRGTRGTEVHLNIFREGEEDTRDIVVKRDVIVVKSVRFEMKENKVALIRVSRFGDDTESEFEKAVNEVGKSGAEKLILDLRNNPGGFLDTAVNMASLMLPSRTVVVIEENGRGERKEMRARGGDVLSGIPTVVLINEGSASASEILAGALQDNRENVTLIGKKSFGKGSVQELIAVGRDTSVKVTVARWLTPQGAQINERGIAPDIEVGITTQDREQDKDPQLEKALEVLSVD
ncbi:MAG: hypothetical protein A2808_00405 [Candidatus Moranbacteria bacterium RIFCSPHIGHO2_01_FULL_55_24]|nr:MAG: hypothetical protein A2808_00405 [Candidatus Moranbacteria bacterium RIFCSPHIGHO2_01_FULL_55_24]